MTGGSDPSGPTAPEATGPEVLLSDLDAQLLSGTEGIPARLAALADPATAPYARTLSAARHLLRLGALPELLPLSEAACHRHPLSIDLALLRVDATGLAGPPEGLESLATLTRQTGRKRGPAAERLARHGRIGDAIALLSAPNAPPNAPPNAAGTDALANRLSLAEFHTRSGQPDTGVALLHDCAVAHPDAPEPARALLRHAAYTGGPEALLTEFDRQALRHPSLPPLVLHELLQLGAIAAAAGFAARPDLPEPPWPLRLRLALQQARRGDALAICNAEIAPRPHTARTERDLALHVQALLEAGQLAEAEAEGQTARRLYPASSRLQTLAAQTAFRAGDWPRALGLLGNAAERFPGSLPHRLALITMLIQTGDYAESQRLLNALPTDLAERSGDETASLLRLRLARASGDLERVRQICTSLAAFAYASREKAAIAAAETALLETRLTEAADSATAALRTFPHSTDLHVLAGKLRFLRGDIAEARAIRERWRPLAEARGETSDTHDLVLAMASADPPPTDTGDADYLAVLQARDSAPDLPTDWMPYLYRRLRSDPDLWAPTAPDRTIPRQILTYWEGARSPAHDLIAEAWEARLPGFATRRFNRATAVDWLRANDHPALAEATRRAENPATGADIFRLAWLAREGGLYVDADEYPRAPVDDWLTGCGLLLTAEKGHFTVANSFIGCTPGHPVLTEALWRIEAGLPGFRGGLDTWMETGPGLLTLCLGRYLARVGKAPEVRVLRPEDYAARVSTTLQLPHKFGATHWRRPTD